MIDAVRVVVPAWFWASAVVASAQVRINLLQGRIMRRTSFLDSAIFALALTGFTVSLSANAQEAGKMARIGVLVAGGASIEGANPGRGSSLAQEFREGLQEVGWFDGKNISIEYRRAEGRYERLPSLAAELVQLKVDIIVATSASATVAAKNATPTIPIVMIGSADPVGLGLIKSLPRPGGNVTGVSFSFGMGAFSKELELLKEAIPRLRRVAVLSNPANSNQVSAMSELKAAAGSLGIQLLPLEVDDARRFEGAFAAMTRERVDALLVIPDTTFNVSRLRIVELAAKNRLPVMYGGREYVEDGGLMSYGPNLSELFRRAALYVDKILKGAKPADMAVEQPTKLELVVNLRTARALGLTIPGSILVRADQIIE